MVVTGIALPPAIAGLGRAQLVRDFRTSIHSTRVAKIIAALGTSLGLARDEVTEIAVASAMHDVGKFAIPIEILHKRDRLSRDEVTLIKSHAEVGHRILLTPGDRMSELAALIALCHHERFDGSGYPHGLAGGAIPLPAQIASICDIYDALREERPYRPSLSHEVAMSIILVGDGRTKPSHFAPRVLTAFCSLSEEIRQVFDDAYQITSPFANGAFLAAAGMA